MLGARRSDNTTYSVCRRIAYVDGTHLSFSGASELSGSGVRNNNLVPIRIKGVRITF